LVWYQHQLVTLNDLEQQPLFCVISLNSIAFQANYVTVVEDRPRPFCMYMYNVRKISPSCIWPKLTNIP